MMFRANAIPVLLSLLCVHSARAQATPVILKVELQNVIFYEVDTADSSKFGANPNITPSALSCNGPSFGGHLGNKVLALGDIVAVNGQPVRGTYSASGTTLCLSPTPVPGQPVADTTHGPAIAETYEFLQTDGTPIGTVMTNGLRVGGPSPPGFPAGTLNTVIVGGTGAYFGARGQTGNVNSTQVLGSAGITPPSRSIMEDPANRRLNQGGHVIFTLYVIPLARSEIATTPNGPAVAHASDFSIVGAAKPAAAGEVLSLFATGLGPTRPGTDPGQPFPSDPLAVVNSPLQVTVNEKPAELVGAVGLPGTVDGYQVNFRIPADTGKGSAAIQVTTAWITGSPVSIPVQ